MDGVAQVVAAMPSPELSGQQPPVPPDQPTTRPSTPAGKVKASFNLWPEELDRLRALAAASRTTVTAVLQRAIADAAFLDEEIQKGAHVLLRYPNGEYREVIMRR